MDDHLYHSGGIERGQARLIERGGDPADTPRSVSAPRQEAREDRQQGERRVNIIVKARHMEVTDAMRQYVEGTGTIAAEEEMGR